MENDAKPGLNLGWSEFALGRHAPGKGHVWYEGTHAELIALVREAWECRQPGFGRTDLDQVVVVPVAPDRFRSATVKVTAETPMRAVFQQRQPQEAGFIKVYASGTREKVLHAAVVLYAAATLEENDGVRSGDFDWEVVCLLAGPVADEPMDPLTMARNMLEKPGGTYCAYTAAQFAEAIWYWAGRAAADSS